MTSRRSVIAEAPIDQQHVAIGRDRDQRARQRVDVMRDALFARRCARRRAPGGLPGCATSWRRRWASGPAASVETTPTRNGRKAAMRTAPLSRRRERGVERGARHREGNDLDGRRPCRPARRRETAASVAAVIASSTPLTPAISAASTTTRPAFAAKRLTRPVKARFGAQIGPREASREAPRRFVLADVARHRAAPRRSRRRPPP